MRMRCAEVANPSGHWCELVKLINVSVKDTTTCGAGVSASLPYVVTPERQCSIICIATATVGSDQCHLLPAAYLFPYCTRSHTYILESRHMSKSAHQSALRPYESVPWAAAPIYDWCSLVVHMRQVRSYCMHAASSYSTYNPRATRTHR
jgi:hypothetical protein